VTFTVLLSEKDSKSPQVVEVQLTEFASSFYAECPAQWEEGEKGGGLGGEKRVDS